jgi:hypothetical protein
MAQCGLASVAALFERVFLVRLANDWHNHIANSAEGDHLRRRDSGENEQHERAVPFRSKKGPL